MQDHFYGLFSDYKELVCDVVKNITFSSSLCVADSLENHTQHGLQDYIWTPVLMP